MNCTPIVYATALLFLAAIGGCRRAEVESYPELSERLMAGGSTTIFSNTSNAYNTPAPGLTDTELALHLDGDLAFEAVFVAAPAPVNPGLGVLFNQSSCISCHPRDGRARHPDNILARSGLLYRTSLPGTDSNGGPLPVPGFGVQVQNQAVFGYTPEARYTIEYTEHVETFPDGEQVTLIQPVIGIAQPYAPFPAGAMLSPRIAPPVFGLGLLEAIPDEHLLAAQDLNDADRDGISGKVNRVWDPVSGSVQTGRFGWKANASSLLVQCAAAYSEDMGITNRLFPDENGAPGPTPGAPDLAQDILDQVTFYTQTLAVPAPRNTGDITVRKGAKIFEQLQCAGCHTPAQRTGPHRVKALSEQVFYPYTDMLLHDMGEGLADHRPDYLADGYEWKTRPLWGIGMTFVVNGHTHFLHDGRARNITEAILWHGGEAENARQLFLKTPKADRDALLAFINSL